MNWKNYCKTLEKGLKKKCEEISKLENKAETLEKTISNTSARLEEYYQQQKDNTYFSNDGKRLICSIIENCQKIIEGIFVI